MQPPLWEPYPRSGVRGSFTSTSDLSTVSPKDGTSRHHLYVELPDSTLALAVKEPGSVSSGPFATTAAAAPGMPPILLDPNTLDGSPGSGGPAFPQTIHFAQYMPIVFPSSPSGIRILGRMPSPHVPIPTPGVSYFGGGTYIPLVEGAVGDPPAARTTDSVVSSSQPLSEAAAAVAAAATGGGGGGGGARAGGDCPIDPDLLRRRQSLRLPHGQTEMLHSCNSESHSETLLVRVQPPLSAAEAASIGLHTSDGVLTAPPTRDGSRDARAAIGLPSIAPPVDAAVGGAMLAALSQRGTLSSGQPALGLPIEEVMVPRSAPASARSAAADTYPVQPDAALATRTKSDASSPDSCPVATGVAVADATGHESSMAAADTTGPPPQNPSIDARSQGVDPEPPSDADMATGITDGTHGREHA